MKYKVKIKRNCNNCNGAGGVLTKGLDGLPEAIKCSYCKGTGKVEEEIEVLEIRPITQGEE